MEKLSALKVHKCRLYRYNVLAEDGTIMGNNQMLPFERNRYYVGKLLTSADFQAEQAYGINKRRFMNEMMFGRGIVCGLSVYSLDDLSIMVDSGVAVDNAGNEIAVEAPIVRKLSAIEGFEGLETERAVLCLEYEEKDVNSIYTVSGSGDKENYECNRVREGWKLFIADSTAIERDKLPATEFFASSVLYSDPDYSVVCTMPAKSACGAVVRIDITVRRLNDSAKPLTLKTAIQTPAFTDEKGNHELLIDLEEINPADELVFHKYMTARPIPAPESVLLADVDAINVQIGGEKRIAPESFTLHTTVVEATVEEIVDEAVSYAGLEMRDTAGMQSCVVLAELSLQRTRNAYLIEDVHSLGIRKYIKTMAQTPLRQELEGWFSTSVQSPAPAAKTENTTINAPHYAEPVYATGICEIVLDVNMRRGQVAYSDEIVHGLGPGTVYITVGAEYIANDEKLGTTARNTIYGNAELFAQEQPTVPQAEYAVKVMNDRGSFIVAARLQEENRQVVLPLRWVAVMMPGGVEEERMAKFNYKSISPVQPTIVMATRESCYINVRFNNMEPCTLTYELTEKDSGTITSDGIYTAPGREGVFEIRISCADSPLVFTYAYVVVKKRSAYDDEE